MIEYNYRGQLTDQGTAAGLSIPKLGKSFCLIAVQLHCRALGSWKSRGTRPFDGKVYLYLGQKSLHLFRHKFGVGGYTPWPPPCPCSDSLAFPRGQHACMTLLNSKLKPTTFTFFSSWLFKFQIPVHFWNSCIKCVNWFQIPLRFCFPFLNNFSVFLIHI